MAFAQVRLISNPAAMEIRCFRRAYAMETLTALMDLMKARTALLNGDAALLSSKILIKKTSKISFLVLTALDKFLPAPAGLSSAWKRKTIVPTTLTVQKPLSTEPTSVAVRTVELAIFFQIITG